MVGMGKWKYKCGKTSRNKRQMKSRTKGKRNPVKEKHRRVVWRRVKGTLGRSQKEKKKRKGQGSEKRRSDNWYRWKEKKWKQRRKGKTKKTKHLGKMKWDKYWRKKWNLMRSKNNQNNKKIFNWESGISFKELVNSGTGIWDRVWVCWVYKGWMTDKVNFLDFIWFLLWFCVVGWSFLD